MKQVDLSTYDNSWYKPGSRIIILLWYIINSVCFNSYLFPISFIKIIILRIFGAKVGKGVVIKPKVNIKYPWKLTIGNHVWIGEQVWIDNLADVIIEDQVCLSQGVFLLTGNHDYSKTTFDLMINSITLKKGCWIGAQSTVCPGVTCHSHSVLAVQSVATRDLEAYYIYQGNPAEKVKKREFK